MVVFKKMFFTLFLFSLISSSAFAKNIWRDCGIGALIFTETGWAAVTSNITWDLGITATSSATSSEGQCAGKSASVGKFLYQNYAMVEEETVMGEGQYLSSVLDILECKRESRPQIIKSIRSKLNKDLNSSDFESRNKIQKTELYYNNLFNVINSNFSESCITS